MFRLQEKLKRAEARGPWRLRFKLKHWFVAGNQGVVFEIASFEALQPIGDEGVDAVHAEVFVERWIFFQIGVGEFEERGGRAKAVFPQMHERTGELNQTFVKGIIGAAAVREPEFFQDIMGFKIKPAIKAFEISEIVGIQIASFELLD